MTTVTPIKFTTPDNIERELRATLGARKRIREKFACDMQEALNQFGDGALPEIAFALMHDAKGKPPAGLSAEELAESIAPEDALSLMSAILAAFSQGKSDPNEIEALLVRVQEATREATSTGSDSGPSVDNASDSQTDKSGGDTSSAKLAHSEEPTSTPKPDSSAS
jgi:hypothetical protein